MTDMTKIGRLAMREEGDHWVVYYAQLDTMDGALRLGLIHMALVQDEARKQAFMAIFRGWLTEALSAKLGLNAAEMCWDVKPAPDSERAGRA